MSIQNELTKLYKKLSEEGLNKEAQRLTPFIKESQFFTFLRPQHNQALRKINRAIRAGQASVAETQLNNLKDLITDEQLMADLKKNLEQGDASGRRKFMRMLKAILKVLKAGGNVTLQNVKQEAETDAPAKEVEKEDSVEEVKTDVPTKKETDGTKDKNDQVPYNAKTEEDSSTTKPAMPSSKDDAVEGISKGYKYFFNKDEGGFGIAETPSKKEGIDYVLKPDDKNAEFASAYTRLYNHYAKTYDMKDVPAPKAPAAAPFNPEKYNLEFKGDHKVMTDPDSFGDQKLKFLLKAYLPKDSKKATLTDIDATQSISSDSTGTAAGYILRYKGKFYGFNGAKDKFEPVTYSYDKATDMHTFVGKA